MPNDMPITPAVLIWARERAGYSLESVSESFPRIDEWEAGESFPSYPQLEYLADKFKIPVAVFFFPEPPDLPPVEESFRTLEPTQIAEIPPRIRLLLHKAQSFQMALEEMHVGRNPAPTRRERTAQERRPPLGHGRHPVRQHQPRELPRAQKPRT